MWKALHPGQPIENVQLCLPNEDKAMDALRPLAIPPGDYMVPHCSGAEEMKSPAFKDKMSKDKDTSSTSGSSTK